MIFRIITRWKKSVAITLIAVFLLDMIPIVSFANSPSSGDVDYGGYFFTGSPGYKVSKVNGGLNYEIPVTSIPEYPLSISYNSGTSVFEDAGAFGFGFSSFSGSIVRIKKGLPDDLNGGITRYVYDNQKLTDYGGSFNANVSVPFPPAFISAGSTIGGGFNNYTGFYSILGKNIGVGIGINDFLSAGLDAGLTLDSRKDGATFTAGVGVGIGFKGLVGANFGAGLSTTHQSKQDPQYFVGGGISVLGNGIINTDNLLKNSGNKSFNKSESTNSFYIPNLYGALPSSTSSGAVKNISLAIPGLASVSLQLSSMNATFGVGSFYKRGFGSYYLNAFNRSDNSHMADFSIEGEANTSIPNSVNYMQKDAFIISVAGLSGNFELMHEKPGLFSRSELTSKNNFTEKGGFLGVNTKYVITSNGQEIDPWLSSGQLRIKRSSDFFGTIVRERKKNHKLIKDGFKLEDVYFTQQNTISHTEEFDDFGPGKPYFRMRADYSDDLRVSSNASKDINPIQIRYSTIPESREKNRFYSGEGDKLAYPVVGNSAQINQHANKIRSAKSSRSTVIREITVKEFIDQLDGLNNLEYSIYSQYDLVDNNGYNLSISNEAIGSGRLQRLSIKDHLKQLRDQENDGADPDYFEDLIAGYEVTSSNGTKYYFTVPVFSFDEKSDGLKGDGHKPPVDDGGKYISSDRSNRKYTRGKVSQFNDFYYPSSWLLTAVVQDDYIDADDIPGPSDGDLGNWVRFNYIRGQEEYTWRAPLIGLEHSEGVLHDKEDDFYSCNRGKKEIYYLASVESRNYESIYTYDQRSDGYGGKDAFVSGQAWNWTYENTLLGLNGSSVGYIDKDKFMLCVSDITLYQKNNPEQFGQSYHVNQAMKDRNRTPISGTAFKYDYSTGRKLLTNENFNRENDAPDISMQPYFFSGSNRGSGHLTLRQVIPYTYDEVGNKFSFPASELYYNSPDYEYSDEEKVLNPKKIDFWGNFNLYAGAPGNLDVDNGTFYSAYEVLSKRDADRNANIFQLQRVEDGSGATYNFDYEANDYHTVQDKPAFTMRKIINATADGNNLKLTVDVTDIKEFYDNLGSVSPESLGLSLEPSISSVFEQNQPVGPEVNGVYAEIAFYRYLKDNTLLQSSVVPQPEGIEKSMGVAIFGDHKMKIESLATSIGEDLIEIPQPDGTTKFYQEITLSADSDRDYIPILEKFNHFMATGSEELAAVTEGKAAPSSVSSLPPIGQDIWEAIKTMGKQLINLLPGFSNLGQLANDYGRLDEERLRFIYEHFSYLRTPVLSGKFTGTRVKQITINDNFQFSSQGEDQGNIYTSEYFYDSNEDGTGFSTGVASAEPGVGPSRAFDHRSMIGSGFFPASRIYYAKVTERNPVPFGEIEPGKGFRPIGKEVCTYLTPDQVGFRFVDNFRSFDLRGMPPGSKSKLKYRKVTGYWKVKRKIRISLGKKKRSKYRTRRRRLKIGLVYHNNKNIYGKVHRYVDVTDYYGKELSQSVYNANGDRISWSEVKYKSPSDQLVVANGSFDSQITHRPGAYEQLWGEMTQKRSYDHTIRRKRGSLGSVSDYLLSYGNYLFVPAVVDEIVTFRNDLLTRVKPQLFDRFTLNPVKSQTIAGNNIYIQTSRPAYWKNSVLGPKASSGSRVNRLTEEDYMVSYKGSEDDNNVLSATFIRYTPHAESEGGGWVVPNEKTLTPENLSNGQYVMRPQEISYQNALDLRRSYALFTYGSSLLRPYQSYQLLSTVSSDGFIADFALKKSVDGPLHQDWKKVSQINLFNHLGNVLEQQDRMGNYSSASWLPSNNMEDILSTLSPYSVTAFTSGEYYYPENDKLQDFSSRNSFKMMDARLVQSCDQPNTTGSEYLNFNDFILYGNIKWGTILTLTPSVPLTTDEPVCKLRLNYGFRQGYAREEVLIFLSQEGFAYGMKPNGSVFNIFLSNRLNSGKVELVIPYNYITSVELLEDNLSAQVTTNLGTTGPLAEDYSNCLQGEKSINVIEGNCAPEAHSGNFAFALEAGKKGCAFEISGANLKKIPSGKRILNYRVWVFDKDFNKIRPKVSFLDKNNGTETTLENLELREERSSAGNWNLVEYKLNLNNLDPAYLSNNYVFKFLIHNITQNSVAHLDDIMIKPEASNVMSYTYDHRLNRVQEVFDNSHLMSRIGYDKLGRTVKGAVEVEGQGVLLTSKRFYGFQKPTN